MMFGLFRFLAKKPAPTTLATIHKSHILHNWGLLQGLHPDRDFFPVLSGNAYGHGIQEIARVFSKVSLPFLAIDSLDECSLLMEQTTQPILLMQPALIEHYGFMNLRRITPCIAYQEAIDGLLKQRGQCIIHLTLSLKSGDIGFDMKSLQRFLDYLATHSEKDRILIEGVMASFSADLLHFPLQDQVAVYKKMFHAIIDAGHLPMYKTARGEVAELAMLKDRFFNAWIPDSVLYGYSNIISHDDHTIYQQKLKPSLRIVSRVVNVRQVEENECIDQKLEIFAKEKGCIVSIDFGYRDGLLSCMQGKLFARYQGEFIQQIGTITQETTSFWLPGVASVNLGQEIELLANETQAHNSLYAWSQAADVSSAELLLQFSSAIPGKVVV